MSDARQGCSADNYWNFLARDLGIDVYVYADNGWRATNALDQARRLFLDLHWYVDAIFVMVDASKCTASMSRDECHDGLNRLFDYLKENFPDQQIVLVTSPNCGFERSGTTGWRNDDILSAGREWSIPVIDLYAECGLLPSVKSHQRFFATDGDALRLNARGQERIARTILCRMLALPPEFKRIDGLFF